MNKKQAIKQRQANQPPKKAEQEIHAADILKGNLIDSPAISPARQNNSLEEQLIAKHETTIDLQKQQLNNLARLIENDNRIFDLQTQQLDNLAGLTKNQNRIIGLHEEQAVALQERIQELKNMALENKEYGRWFEEETRGYREVIARLQGRIEELESARGGSPGSAAGKVRELNAELGDQGASTVRQGEQKAKMEWGACIVS